MSVSGETFEEKVEDAKAALVTFNRAPFTLQRFAEILVHPGKHHRNVNKLLNGYEKLLSVTSTVARQDPEAIKAQEAAATAEAGDTMNATTLSAAAATTQEAGADAMDIA